MNPDSVVSSICSFRRGIYLVYCLYRTIEVEKRVKHLIALSTGRIFIFDMCKMRLFLKGLEELRKPLSGSPITCEAGRPDISQIVKLTTAEARR